MSLVFIIIKTKSIINLCNNLKTINLLQQQKIIKI
jgi:hypothetical protein